MLTSVSISPAMVSVTASGTQQYSATALDQSVLPMSPQPTFSWSVSGGGSINSSGKFTAGTSAGGPYNVTATASGKSGIGSITVVAAPSGGAGTRWLRSPTHSCGMAATRAPTTAPRRPRGQDP